MTTENKPSHITIRAQLERILQNPRFRGSDKQKSFLKFVVNQYLLGKESELKGYTIAIEVYGRKEGFDPQSDPIVRVEAGRLRRALEHYYLTEGSSDPIQIDIPKGAYLPVFHTSKTPPEVETLLVKQNESRLNTDPSLAVMPLINLMGDDRQSYFTDGLTEELTAEMARYQEFKVIASQSAMQFKNNEVDPKVIGSNLKVRFIVTGSVRKALNTVKIAIRLLDTSNGGQVWGDSYTYKLTPANLISIQERIAKKVIGVIADQYGLMNRELSKETRKKIPADMKAYDAVLHFYNYEVVLTPEKFNIALDALEKAVESDPGYGMAWAMLGHLHADNHALGFCEIENTLEKALEFALRGVALEPENQFAHDALTLVYFHLGEKASFLKHVAKTIALNPNAPYITGVAGWHLMLYGEWNRGLTLLQKGIRLNPYHPTWFHLAPFMDYYHQGKYEKAYNESLKFHYPELFWSPLMRSVSLGQMDRNDEAKTALANLLSLEPDFAFKGRKLISNYVKVDKIVDKIVEGLQKVGLDNLK